MIDSRYPVVLVELFALAKQRGCIIAPIRPKLLDVESIHDGDLDVVMSPDHADILMSATWDVLSEKGMDFAIVRQRQEKIRIEIIDSAVERTITLEVWLSLQVKKSPAFSRRIAWERISDFVSPSTDSITGFKLHPELEACYYLSHLQSKRKQIDSPVVISRLAYYSALDDISAETRAIFQGLNSQDGIKMAASLANKRLNALGILDKHRIINWKGISARLAKLIFDARLLQSKSSSFITFSGPDGVGKTTLIEYISKEIFDRSYYFKFKNTYRKSIAYHILYFFMKKYHQFRTGSALQKNQVDELSYSFLIVISAFRFMLRDFFNIITKKVCLADRTFSDFHIIGARFHGQPLLMNQSTLRLGWLTPRPRAMIHLNAPAETIFQRKQELSIQQIKDYQHLTLASYMSQPCSIYMSVNTDRPLEACIKSFRVMRGELA